MPERDPTDENRVYNTMTVWNPQGELIAKFRKLHLYDVNIPGGIVFTESDAIRPGSNTVVVKFRQCHVPNRMSALKAQHSEPSLWASALISDSPI